MCRLPQVHGPKDLSTQTVVKHIVEHMVEHIDKYTAIAVPFMRSNNA
jgi:hypothetical protein